MLEENTQLINSFSNRCVRDLAWVIASPPLVSGKFTNTVWWDQKKCTTEFEDCQNSLHLLDQDPSPLINHLESIKSKRLGLRFEAYVSFWLDKISPNFDLLAQNIQLFEYQENKRTIGEIDFIIIEKQTAKIIHLEVAVKFYLGTQPYADPYRWFGTNTNDQLGRKLDHLKQHQTQLLIHHADKISNFIDQQTINERHCILKGRLFYPWSLLAQPSGISSVAPKGVTENHLTGLYVKENNQQQFTELKQQNNQKLISLDKIDWLSPLNQFDLIKHPALPDFNQLDRPQCYALTTKRAGKEFEVNRLFYLPRNFQFPR